MKKAILGVLAVSLVYGHANACNSQAVKTAQELLDIANKNYTSGLVGITDTYEAKSHLLEMQLCQNPKDSELCKNFTSSLAQTFERLKAGHSMGLNPMSDVLAAHTKLVQVKIQCDL